MCSSKEIGILESEAMQAGRNGRGVQYSNERMKKCMVLWCVAVTLLWSKEVAFSQSDPVLSLSELMRESLRQRLEAVSIPTQLTVESERLRASAKVLQFYMLQTYQPAWSNDAGPLPQVESLLTTLRTAEQDGFRSEDYHLSKLGQMLADIRRMQATAAALHPEKLTTLDILLTDAFLTYGLHALTGRINPDAVQAQWFTARQQTDIVDILRHALETNRTDEALRTLLPPEPGYERLRQALAHYRTI